MDRPSHERLFVASCSYLGETMTAMPRRSAARDGLRLWHRPGAFPALRERASGAAAASDVRGAGPLRQVVRCRAAGSVLLVGDASRKSWLLSSGPLWSRYQTLLAQRIEPPRGGCRIFSSSVNQVAQG
jgi:hypothetical protein